MTNMGKLLNNFLKNQPVIDQGTLKQRFVNVNWTKFRFEVEKHFGDFFRSISSDVSIISLKILSVIIPAEITPESNPWNFQDFA